MTERTVRRQLTQLLPQNSEREAEKKQARAEQLEKKMEDMEKAMVEMEQRCMEQKLTLCAMNMFSNLS